MIVQSIRKSSPQQQVAKNMQNQMIISHLHMAHGAAESLARQGFTVLDIDVSGTPKITIQYRGRCAALKPTRLGRINNEAGSGFMMTAKINKCVVRWIEPAHVKELQDRQRTRPVDAKPKAVTRIQHWGITE